MTNIERKDHTAFILDIDDHPVVPDPEPEHPRERARQRLEEVSRIVSPLDLVQFSYTRFWTARSRRLSVFSARGVN